MKKVNTKYTRQLPLSTVSLNEPILYMEQRAIALEWNRPESSAGLDSGVDVRADPLPFFRILPSSYRYLTNS